MSSKSVFFIVTGEHWSVLFSMLGGILESHGVAPCWLIGGNPQWLCAMLFRIAG